jgi:hypothetical protein
MRRLLGGVLHELGIAANERFVGILSPSTVPESLWRYIALQGHYGVYSLLANPSAF